MSSFDLDGDYTMIRIEYPQPLIKKSLELRRKCQAKKKKKKKKNPEKYLVHTKKKTFLVDKSEQEIKKTK